MYWRATHHSMMILLVGLRLPVTRWWNYSNMSTRRENEISLAHVSSWLTLSVRRFLGHNASCFFVFIVLSAAEDQHILFIKECFDSWVFACIFDTETACQKSTASNTKTYRVGLPLTGRLPMKRAAVRDRSVKLPFLLER